MLRYLRFFFWCSGAMMVLHSFIYEFLSLAISSEQEKAALFNIALSSFYCVEMTMAAIFIASWLISICFCQKEDKEKKEKQKRQDLQNLTEAMERATHSDLPTGIAILMDAGFSLGSGQIWSLLPPLFWSVYPELVAKTLGTLTVYFRQSYPSQTEDLLSYFVEGITQLPSDGIHRYDQVYLTVLFSQAVIVKENLDEVVKRRRLCEQTRPY